MLTKEVKAKIEKAVEDQRTEADEYIKMYTKQVQTAKAMLYEFQEGKDYWENRREELQNGKDQK